MEWSRKFSSLSNINWQGRIIGRTTPYDNFGERWKYDSHTRSNLSNIETCNEIVSFFGDSFIYGHGVKKHFAIDYIIQSRLDSKSANGKRLYVNYGQPGGSNERSLLTIEQWFNSKYSEKTRAICYGFAPLDRTIHLYTPEYTDYTKFEGIEKSPIYYDLDDAEEFKSDKFSVVNVNGHKDTNIDGYQNTKHYKSYVKKWEYVTLNNNPIDSLYTLETTIKRLYWISKALEIPVIYYYREGWLKWLSKKDREELNNKLKDIENKSKLRRISVDDRMIKPHHHLPDGHWNKKGNEIVAQKFYEVLKEMI